jgi:hypothetical protein
MGLTWRQLNKKRDCGCGCGGDPLKKKMMALKSEVKKTKTQIKKRNYSRQRRRAMKK